MNSSKSKTGDGGRRPLRGLRAFLDTAEEPGSLAIGSSSVSDSDQGGRDSAQAGEGVETSIDLMSASAVCELSNSGASQAEERVGTDDWPATRRNVKAATVTILPPPGQRWAYGLRKQHMAERKAWRAAERARTPLQRFEAVLAELPTTGRPAINLDLVQATLAASAPNTVRGLFSDMRQYGDHCRSHGVSALPSQPASVIAFLKVRATGKTRAKSATLSRILWAIATFHRLFDVPDPTKDKLVTLEMKALRRELGTAQQQARPLRYKGAVSNIFGDEARGVSLKALLDGCGSDEKGLRDRALLSVAYDTGLRASELVAIDIVHIRAASDPDTRMLHIPRHKGDQEGEGATAFLSMRSVLALQAWVKTMADLLAIPEMSEGPIFRRLFIKRLKPADPALMKSVERRRAAAQQLGLRALAPISQSARRTGTDPQTVVTLGEGPLRPQAVTQIFKSRVQEAWDQGLLPDLTAQELAQWIKGISAHSTRIGMTNDLFAAGEDIAGIMDALRWKSPKMPLTYNRNLAAEHGAAGRLLSKLK